VAEPPAATVETVAEPAAEPVAPPAERPMPDYEQPALSGEALAEFALVEPFAEPPPATAVEHVPEAPSQPDPHTVSPFDTPAVETPDGEVPLQTTTSDIGDHQHEPSPYVEAVADEPPPAAEPAASIDAAASPSIAPPPAKAPSWIDEPAPNTRRHPLRFMWQMDAEGRFSLGSDEFTRLIGVHAAAGFGRLWSEIAEVFGLDPDGRVLKAVATRDTWSGITLNWPVDGGDRLPVELSGLPIYDRMRNFAGYRGFGVCRDLDGMARLAALRRHELFSDLPTPEMLAADIVQAGPAADLPSEPGVSSSTLEPPS
jgi:hypothetical protein